MSAKDIFFSEVKEFSRAEERVFAREELVYNVTEDILVSLEDMSISKKELARRLGKSRSYVTQILSGARNMTLGTLSDICFALGVKPKVIVTGESVMDRYAYESEIHWTMEESSLKVDEIISKSENIYNYQNPKVWESQDQAA